MVFKRCVICDATFDAVASHKTCGEACSAVLLANRTGRGPKFRSCVICGTQFRIFSGTVLTCSETCSFQRKRQTERTRVRKKKNRTGERLCVICGKEFPCYGSLKTCGEECRLVNKKESERRQRQRRDKALVREQYQKWIAIPENRNRVRESQRQYEIRRLARLSEDEQYLMEERAKSRELDRKRRERRKADAELMRLHRKQVRESQARRNKQRSEMTTEELAEVRRKDREEMRRYAADPVRRARMNKLKREGVRRRNAEAFTGTVMRAMVVLTTALDQENRNE
jgi:predicted nucleic acid-binding Zn ribbon protein